MRTEKNRAPPTEKSWERTRYKAAYAALFFCPRYLREGTAAPVPETGKPM